MLERMSTVAVLASRPHKGAACVPFAALCFYIYTITNAAWNPCWLALNLKNCARVLWQSPAQAFWDSWSHLKVLDHRQDFTTIAALGISSWARVRVKMTPLASALQHNSSNMRYWSFSLHTVQQSSSTSLRAVICLQSAAPYPVLLSGAVSDALVWK